MKNQGDSYENDLEPPPSYNEAISSNSSVGSSTYNISEPPLPQRPSTESRPPPQPPRPTSNHYSRPSSSSTGDNLSEINSLYTNNPNLPFKYPVGIFCRKCKNTGFKKRDKICTECWYKHYLNDNAYNPNSSLPFKYPKRFICEKCLNKGYKLKNGKSCQDCWERFARRNVTNVQYTTSNYMPFSGPTSVITNAIGNFNYSLPPMRVNPGDPRLGGILCGKCRGSGRTYFLLDEDICPVCSGLGRVINLPQNFQQGPPPGPRPGPGPGPGSDYYQPPPQQQGTYNSYPSYNPSQGKN